MESIQFHFERICILPFTKEYEIEGRYNWRGPPYHMIIHALQTVLYLYKKYLSDVQLPRIQ